MAAKWRQTVATCAGIDMGRSLGFDSRENGAKSEGVDVDLDLAPSFPIGGTTRIVHDVDETSGPSSMFCTCVWNSLTGIGLVVNS